MTAIVEYPFLSKAICQSTIESILNQKKHNKYVITREQVNLYKKILQLPKDTSLSTSYERHWVKESFKISYIGETVKLIHAKTLKEVCCLEDIYEAFCESHLAIQHGGHTATWKQFSENWSFVKRDLIFALCNKCSTCSNQKVIPKLCSAKPIIAKAFLSRIQVNFFIIIYFFYFNYIIFNFIFFFF
jgi:hypothetical protein